MFYNPFGPQFIMPGYPQQSTDPVQDMKRHIRMYKRLQREMQEEQKKADEEKKKKEKEKGPEKKSSFSGLEMFVILTLFSPLIGLLYSYVLLTGVHSLINTVQSIAK